MEGTRGRRWETEVCLLRQKGSGNVIEVENVIAVGGVVPFDFGELAVVINVFASEAAVK